MQMVCERDISPNILPHPSPSREGGLDYGLEELGRVLGVPLGLRRSCPGSFACLPMDLQRIFLSTLMVSVFIIAGGADWQDYLNVARRRAKSPGFTAPPYYTRRKGKYKNMLIENNSILDLGTPF